MREKGRNGHLILQLLQKHQAKSWPQNEDRKPEGNRQKPPSDDRGRVEMVYKGESSKQEEPSRKRKPPPLESWMMQSISFEPPYRKNTRRWRQRAEIMFEHCFKRLDEDLKARLVPYHLPLIGFSGESVLPVGKVTLLVTLGEGDRFHIVNLTFSVVQANSKNNIIMGRPGIKAFRRVVSTNHRIMKFPTPKGIASVSTAVEIVAALDRTKENQNAKQEAWMIHDNFTEQTVKVGAQLSNKGFA
ncbi:hypothetical protein L1987_11698 [Smallanthus sonchifolius]|uniref:Uncharacterized protein n=1 Tax=Smallanthus sonchifolius TaxID=185202 RepID=A0ACB9JBQ4_9ASTR|nr:hypothetical protein L1987_11698 [Smallanthus sonchifolius]